MLSDIALRQGNGFNLLHMLYQEHLLFLYTITSFENVMMYNKLCTTTLSVNYKRFCCTCGFLCLCSEILLFKEIATILGTFSVLVLLCITAVTLIAFPLLP